MAVVRVKTWTQGEILTHTDLNAEFSNVYSNGEALGWPATKAKNLATQKLILDTDGDTSITADTDDRIDFELKGTDLLRFDGTAAIPVNGMSFVASVSGTDPSIEMFGENDNIGLNIVPKNSGNLQVNGSNVLDVDDDDAILAQLVFS